MTRRSILASLLAFLAAPFVRAKPVRILGLDRGSDRDGVAMAYLYSRDEMASGLHVWCQVENDDPISKLPLDGLVWFHTPSAGIFVLCTVSGEPVKQTSLPKIVFGKKPK